MTTFAVQLVFDQDESYRLAVRPAHREHLAALTAAGTLLSAGPYADGEGALLLYDVDDRAALEAAVAADPYFAGGQPAATVAAIHEWSVLDLGAPAGPEVDELLAALERHRGFLRQTLDGLTDEQAGLRPTVSALCLGGLIKHVAATEKSWVEFAVHGEQESDADVDWESVDWSNPSPEVMAAMAAREAEFAMVEGDSIASVLTGYAEVAAETERIVRGLDLDSSHELPRAPWFEEGERWSVRRVLVHLVAETSQHAGHADILRESIDGARTMG